MRIVASSLLMPIFRRSIFDGGSKLPTAAKQLKKPKDDEDFVDYVDVDIFEEEQ